MALSGVNDHTHPTAVLLVLSTISPRRISGGNLSTLKPEFKLLVSPPDDSSKEGLNPTEIESDTGIESHKGAGRVRSRLTDNNIYPSRDGDATTVEMIHIIQQRKNRKP